MHGSEADDGCGEDEEGAVEVGVAFVSDDEAAELVDPGEGPFDDPSVLSKMSAAFDATPCDAGRDVSAAQFAPAEGVVVAFVGVQLGGPLARSSAPLANRLYRVDDRRQNFAVMAVGARQDDGEGKAAPIDDDMALRPRPAAIGRVRADRFAPFLAATDEESADARDQSISPARLSRSSKWRWILSQRPASCQALSLRQQVIPEQPATSNGRRSHGVAVYSTNRIPISASLAPTGGRPPFGRGRSGGNSGAISAQRASGRSGLAIPKRSAKHG